MFILNFHGLGRPPSPQGNGGDDAYWTEPAFFAAVLKMVRERADVLITLDDSNESDYSVALPLLKDAGLSARFFVVAARVGQKGFLSAAQIQDLVKEGMNIGSHGMLHRKWPNLNDSELHQELVTARDSLEQIAGNRILEAACPFGAYNRRVLGRLRAAGYERVLTSDEGPASQTCWIWPRNTIVCTDELEKVSRRITQVPSGAPGVLRRLKLMIKRLR